MIRAHTFDNPWGLTDIEYLAVDAVARLGTNGAACAELKWSWTKLGNALARARWRMRVVGRVQMITTWLEWKTPKAPPPPPPAPAPAIRTNWKSVQPCACCHGLGFVPKAAA